MNPTGKTSRRDFIKLSAASALVAGTSRTILGSERSSDQAARISPSDRIRLATIGVGGQGMGLQVKLTQNLIGALTCQAMAEGFVLARKAGLSPSLVLEVLQASVARNPMIEAKLPLVLSRRFEPHFSLKWMHKDLGLMLDSAQDLQVPLPATALVRELFGAAIAMGHGEQDFAAAITLLETLAGVKVTEDPSHPSAPPGTHPR